jgi:hypothetical protein
VKRRENPIIASVGNRTLVVQPVVLSELGVDGKIILEWILGKYSEKVWRVDLAQDRPVEGCCEHGNEISASIKSGDF